MILKLRLYSPKNDSEINALLKEWISLIKKSHHEIENIQVEMFKKIFLDHPKIEKIINWKDCAIQNGATMLICEIWYGGRLDIVKLLLEHGADFAIPDADGDTPLMNASWKGHTKIVKLLVEKGADVNTADKDGMTALMFAAQEGHIEIVKLLVYEGAELNTVNKNGKSALMYASRNGHSEIVKLFMENGVDDSDIVLEKWKTLIKCSEDEIANVDAEMFKKVFLKHPKKDRFINWKDDGIRNGMTMLICEIWYGGRLDIVKLLLKHGADITIPDADGDTALMNASGTSGRFDIVKLMVDNGADMNIANKKGDTALMNASREGHVEIVKFLVENGADATTSNNYGKTALDFAFDRGYEEVMKVLMKKDPNIISNCDGQTYLHLACMQNKKEAALCALEVGTDKDKLDSHGHTALFYAAEEGYADIVELLVANNADGNKTDEREIKEKVNAWGRAYSFYMVEDGRTPLFIAAQKGFHDVVATLLQHGADPYLCNHESKIPRDVSKVHGSIQQLFAIHDYFDQREQGDLYRKTYMTCKDDYDESYEFKEWAPQLEDIIHDIVKYPHFANQFLELYQENPEVVNWLDKDGRAVQQMACRECREVILFLRQYHLDKKPFYESPTCKIYHALDYGGPDEPNLKQPREVVMKFFENKEHFENEMGARQIEKDGASRFSQEFVIPHLAAYQADENKEFAEACRKWARHDGHKADPLPGFCAVLEQGERSLAEAMNAENLSAEHKDFQRREILLTLCNIFSYIHGGGYVHGDIKPHNAVRYIGERVTWKAIDFDACTEIGKPVGLKVTTGSAPPELLKVVKEGQDHQVVLRQPGGSSDECELVKADPSFDVWSYGILMYQLVTGRSFFHCDIRGNVDDTGLLELATLTQLQIDKKLDGVGDANARVLLSRILRFDPKERPTMQEISMDFYFLPSDSPQGRKAEFFRKQALEESSTETFSDEEESENVEDIERFLSSKKEFSYFKLRDEDKDWSDKLLNSEVETFRFDELGGMGEKPKLIDGDTIYGNDFLRRLIRSKGPDYFMGVLVEYFELYKIMNDAHEVCQEIKVNLVSNVKDLKGIFMKLFVRGKGLNDIVRGTLFCNSIDQFKYVGRRLNERYGHNVYIKPPKEEVGAWPIPKLLIYSNRQFQGRCMTVEIQFSTVYMHLATYTSNNHLVYEAIRASTGYLGEKDEKFQEFLRMLNEQYIDTEGFLPDKSSQEGHFFVLLDQADDNDSGNGTPRHFTKATGFIKSGRICCGGHIFQFMSSKDHLEKFSESSFVVNKCLTLLSSHSYWSDELYDLECKVIEFVVSFKGRGLVIAGIGTSKCLHGSDSSNGTRCSVHVGRSKFVVRKSGVEEVFQEKKLPNQERAKIRFELKDGTLSISLVGSTGEEMESAQVSLNMPLNQRYYLYMRAPPGVHDVKFHDISIHDDSQ